MSKAKENEFKCMAYPRNGEHFNVMSNMIHRVHVAGGIVEKI